MPGFVGLLNPFNAPRLCPQHRLPEGAGEAGSSKPPSPLRDQLPACPAVCAHEHASARASVGGAEGGAGRMGAGGGDEPVFPQVLKYDYYGAYGNQAHGDHAYGRLLGDEYTFDFPPHHDVVSG